MPDIFFTGKSRRSRAGYEKKKDICKGTEGGGNIAVFIPSD